MELSKVFDRRGYDDSGGVGEGGSSGLGSTLVVLGEGNLDATVKVGDYFEGNKVDVPPHQAPLGAASVREDPGTVIVWTGRTGKHEVLVNYSCDGFSPLDWFLTFGFVPLERRRPWRREPECLRTVGGIHVHDSGGEGGEKEMFRSQQRRGEKWRREKEGK
jgi:hypothetical protein